MLKNKEISFQNFMVPEVIFVQIGPVSNFYFLKSLKHNNFLLILFWYEQVKNDVPSLKAELSWLTNTRRHVSSLSKIISELEGRA